jgi:hypothetical protein
MDNETHTSHIVQSPHFQMNSNKNDKLYDSLVDDKVMSCDP